MVSSRRAPLTAAALLAAAVATGACGGPDVAGSYPSGEGAVPQRTPAAAPEEDTTPEPEAGGADTADAPAGNAPPPDAADATGSDTVDFVADAADRAANTTDSVAEAGGEPDPAAVGTPAPEAATDTAAPPAPVDPAAPALAPPAPVDPAPTAPAPPDPVALADTLAAPSVPGPPPDDDPAASAPDDDSDVSAPDDDAGDGPDPADPQPASDTLPAEPLDDFLSTFADLGVRFRGRMEMGGEWTRFRPCDTEAQASCDPSLVPQLRPDLQFGVELGGTLSERVHVDVDYDEAREFAATNDVRLEYRGRPGETLQRVEVGDVSLDLPRSRFLTGGVPSGTFGFRADGGAGPLRLQAVWAQQTGELSTRTLRLSDVDGDPRVVQDDTLVVDDAEYARGQFFFLVDPREITGHPHVDALALGAADAPADVAPGAEPVRVYRLETDPVTRQQVEGYVRAEAVAGADGDEVRASGWFRYLQPGVDYAVHSSGLWIALRRPLDRDEMLAVTYVTAAGDTVGTYHPERAHNRGATPTLRLLKAAGADHRPGRPTWEQEMHQVYRISGSGDVDPETVEVEISLGERSGGRTFAAGPRGEDVSFLRLFGLDEQAPADELDGTALYRPAEEYLLDPPPVRGLFLVFPTLEPFRRPPPSRAAGLSEEEAAELLGADANERIYTDPDLFERRNAGLYRLTVAYRTRSDDATAGFSLGALGVRDGSERIYLGDRMLQRGVDYRIDYDLGRVDLINPSVLRAAGPDAEIRITWEQNQVFRVAPTSVVGLRGRWDLGERGGVDVLGLRQAEDALVNRPTLGVEPASVALGGVRTDLTFGAQWLDEALASVPGLRTDGEATVDVRGEVAVSRPDPNTRGAVFLDDFDASGERAVSLEAEDWRLGSAPESREGAEDALPAAVGVGDAARLVWQHQWIQLAQAGDSVGVFEGFFPRRDIDRRINVAGNPRREAGLLLTFGGGEGLAGVGGGGDVPDPFPDGPKWRSVTTVLSPRGMDLTRSEFLELYVAQGEEATLVVDLGEVSEDALFFDDEGRVNGVKDETGEPWGLGILDQEADPARGEIWSDPADARGLWDEACSGQRGRVYRVGDPRANCTRDNGLRDTEDLDENGVLDTRERHLRFVIRLDGSSPYLARTTDETGTAFRLFRIPLRGGEGTPVGGFSPRADLRRVKHLRLTVAGERPGTAVLARMRIVGSRWAKRGPDGVLRGRTGDEVGTGGRVDVGPVSGLSDGAAYSSPPGVREELDDPTAAFQGSGVEFQERALGVSFEGLAPGERAEVYHRYAQRPRDFLDYRRMRLWAVAREGDWGSDAPVYVFLKVGSDPDNFYLYRRRIRPAPDPGSVRPEDWGPEVVVDLERWMELRERAETEMVEAPPAPGEPLEVWDADSTHAVVLRDRGRAPNLAAVRELSLGVMNEDGAPVSGEVWWNELRLDAELREPGAAGFAEVDVRAGEVLDARVSYSDRGAFFRRLEQGASYQEGRDLHVDGTLGLHRFAPEGWGLRMPLRVSHSRSDRDPHFLQGTDLRAARLDRLRRPRDRRTRISLVLGRELSADERDSWLDVLSTGLEARVGLTRSRGATVTVERAADVLDAGVGWGVRPPDRRTDLVPDALRGTLGALLPGFLEDPLFRSRLRWTPARVSVRTGYLRRRAEIRRFEQIVRRPSDGEVAPLRSPAERLETAARLELRPFETLEADLDLTSVRDLLAPERATGEGPVQELLARERLRWGGLDLGWETNRSLRTRLGWRPELAEWLTTSVDVTARYGSLRDPELVERRAAGADTLRALQRNVSGRRDLRTAVSLDPGTLVRSWTGAEEGGDAGAVGGGGPDGAGGDDEADAGDEADADDGGGLALRTLRAAFDALDPLSLRWDDGLTTRFNRQVVSPGAGFQLGWAGEDAYRRLDGDTAALVVDREALRLGGGVRLPLDLSVRVEYSRSRSHSLDPRSERALRRETWPDVRIRVGELPLPEAVEAAVSRVSLGTGLRRTEQRTTFGSQGAQLRVERAVELPVDVTVAWTGGVRTRYRASVEVGKGLDPTGRTDRDRAVHAVSVSAAFRPPGGWAAGLERPVHVTLDWQHTGDRNCRTPAGRGECVAFVDQRNRTVNLTLDTRVQRLDVGFQASWVDRQSFVERHPGSTQLQLGLFGQFQLDAGNGDRL